MPPTPAKKRHCSLFPSPPLGPRHNTPQQRSWSAEQSEGYSRRGSQPGRGSGASEPGPDSRGPDPHVQPRGWFLCDTWHVNTLTAQALPQDIQNVTLLVQLGMQSSLSDLCQHPALPRAPLSTQVARALCVRHFEHSLERGWLSLCLHRALSCKTDRRFNCLNLRSLFLLFFFFFFHYSRRLKKILLWFMSKNVLPIFSLKGSRVPSLTLRF